MKSNKNLGFTVAEVLIAIGVVGLLTLLLVSVFRSNSAAAWQKSKDYKLGIIKYDKVYNAINYSFTNQALKNAGFFKSDADKTTALSGALNELNSTCKGSSCNFNSYSDAKEKDLKYELSDGTQLSVQKFASNKGSAGGISNLSYIIYVDTNGKEKPNQLGKDILPIYIDSNGNVFNVNPKTGKSYLEEAQKKYKGREFRISCGDKYTPGSYIMVTKDSKTGLFKYDKHCTLLPQKCDQTLAKAHFKNMVMNDLKAVAIEKANNEKSGEEGSEEVVAAPSPEITIPEIKDSDITLTTAGNEYTLKYVTSDNIEYLATYTKSSTQACEATLNKGTSCKPHGNPWEIKTKDDLIFMKSHLDCNYKLMNDLSVGSWTPPNGYFTGIFDGQNKTLSDLTSSTGGLFKLANNATIKDLKVNHFTVNTSAGNVGTVVGSATNTHFKNISITNSTVSGGQKIGGLVGYNNSYDINSYKVENCHISGSTITASDYGGGLIGDMEKITVEKCSAKNTGVNTSDWGSGGLIGRTLSSIVNTSYAINSTIKGRRATGGFIGCACCALIYNCYTINTIQNAICGANNKTKYDASGGFTGQFSGYISSCYSAGTVTGNCVGGFLGVFHDGHFGNSPAAQAGSPVKNPTITNAISTTEVHTSNASYAGVFYYSSEHCDGKAYTRSFVTNQTKRKLYVNWSEKDGRSQTGGIKRVNENKENFNFTVLNNSGGIGGAENQWNNVYSYHPTLKNNPE